LFVIFNSLKEGVIDVQGDIERRGRCACVFLSFLFLPVRCLPASKFPRYVD
jgi:hypothetical protein